MRSLTVKLICQNIFALEKKAADAYNTALNTDADWTIVDALQAEIDQLTKEALAADKAYASKLLFGFNIA
jgi:hypothetical protein